MRDTAATADPVTAPSHYRGKSGLQSIEVTHAYRLGPDLTQAVDYILRAGRKTADPRQDLAKAIFYLQHAAGLRRDRTFGRLDPKSRRPAAMVVAEDFDRSWPLSLALFCILRERPTERDIAFAAGLVQEAMASGSVSGFTAGRLVDRRGRPRKGVPHAG